MCYRGIYPSLFFLYIVPNDIHRKTLSWCRDDRRNISSFTFNVVLLKVRPIYIYIYVYVFIVASVGWFTLFDSCALIPIVIIPYIYIFSASCFPISASCSLRLPLNSNVWFLLGKSRPVLSILQQMAVGLTWNCKWFRSTPNGSQAVMRIVIRLMRMLFLGRTNKVTAHPQLRSGTRTLLRRTRWVLMSRSVALLIGLIIAEICGWGLGKKMWGRQLRVRYTPRVFTSVFFFVVAVLCS